MHSVSVRKLRWQVSHVYTGTLRNPREGVFVALTRFGTRVRQTFLNGALVYFRNAVNRRGKVTDGRSNLRYAWKGLCLESLDITANDGRRSHKGFGAM